MNSRAQAAILCVVLALPGAWALAEDRDQWQQPDRVMADLALGPGLRVGDIGCGDGYFMVRLAKAVGETGRVFAVDISEKSLAALRKTADHHRLTNIVTVLSEPTNTLLAEESADVILVCDVLHEVPEAQRLPLMKSAVRALKPGGVFFLLDYRKSREVRFDPYEKLIPRDDLLKLCADAGLKLDAEFAYLKYQVFFRFRKTPIPIHPPSLPAP